MTELNKMGIPQRDVGGKDRETRVQKSKELIPMVTGNFVTRTSPVTTHVERTI